MEFTNAELKARLVVPDEPTVRQVLAYDSRVELIAGAAYERFWRAAGALVTEFESPVVAIDQDLNVVQGAEQLKITLATIKWAGMAVFSFRQSLDELPKNS